MELKGKIIDFLGDSITEGNGVTEVKYRYDSIIKEKCALKAIYNYGIGGTRIAHKVNPSERPIFDLCFCGRAYMLNKEADIIIVFGGTNDFSTGDAPFGKMTDKTPATFCGAVEFLMTLLKTEYPNAQIVFLTPARRENDVRASGEISLIDYVNAILQKGKEHNIPVLNLYEKLGINPNIPEQKAKYTTDGLHFNNDGHAVIAERVIEFLENL